MEIRPKTKILSSVAIPKHEGEGSEILKEEEIGTKKTKIDKKQLTEEQKKALRDTMDGNVPSKDAKTSLGDFQIKALKLFQKYTLKKAVEKLREDKSKILFIPGIKEETKNAGLKYNNGRWEGVKKDVQYDDGYNNKTKAGDFGETWARGIAVGQMFKEYHKEMLDSLDKEAGDIVNKFPDRVMVGETTDEKTKENKNYLVCLGVNDDHLNKNVGDPLTGGGQLSANKSYHDNNVLIPTTLVSGAKNIIELIFKSEDPIFKDFKQQYKECYDEYQNSKKPDIKAKTISKDKGKTESLDISDDSAVKEVDSYIKKEGNLNHLAKDMGIQEDEINETDWLALQHVNGALGNAMLKPQNDEGKCNREKVAFFIGSIGGDHTTQSKILNTLTSMKDEFIKNKSEITNIKSETEDVKKAMEAVKKAMEAVSDEINKLHILNEGNAFENKNSIIALCKKIPDGLCDINRQIDQMKEPEVDAKKNQEMQSVIQNQVDDLIKETNNADWHLRVKDDLVPYNFNYYTDPLPNLNDTFYIFGPLNYTANHYATVFIEVTKESFNVHSYSGDITADRITEMRQRLIDSHYFDSLDADTAKVEKAIKAKKIQNIKSKIMIDGTEVQNATGQCGDASIFLTIIIQWLLYTKRKVNDWGNVNITSEEAKQALQACYNKNLVDDYKLYTDNVDVKAQEPYKTDNSKFVEGMREYYCQHKKFNPNQLQRTFKDDDIDTFLNNIKKKNENIGAVCRRFFLKTKVLEATNEYILANRQDFSKQDIKEAEDAIKKAQEKEKTKPTTIKKTGTNPLPHTMISNPRVSLKPNGKGDQDTTQLNQKPDLTEKETNQMLQNAFNNVMDEFGVFALHLTTIVNHAEIILAMLSQKIKMDELNKFISAPEAIPTLQSFSSYMWYNLQFQLKKISQDGNQYTINDIFKNSSYETIEQTYIPYVQAYKYKPPQNIFSSLLTQPDVPSADTSLSFDI